MSHTLFSIAFGVGTRNRTEQWLEVFFPKPLLQPSDVFTERVKAILGYEGGNQIIDFNFATASDLAHALKYIAPEQSALLVRQKVINRLWPVFSSTTYNRYQCLKLILSSS